MEKLQLCGVGLYKNMKVFRYTALLLVSFMSWALLCQQTSMLSILQFSIAIPGTGLESGTNNSWFNAGTHKHSLISVSRYRQGSENHPYWVLYSTYSKQWHATMALNYGTLCLLWSRPIQSENVLKLVHVIYRSHKHCSVQKFDALEEERIGKRKF